MPMFGDVEWPSGGDGGDGGGRTMGLTSRAFIFDTTCLASHPPSLERFNGWKGSTVSGVGVEEKAF